MAKNKAAGKRRKPLAVYLSYECEEKLRAAAYLWDRTLSDLVAEAIESWVDQLEPKDRQRIRALLEIHQETKQAEMAGS